MGMFSTDEQFDYADLIQMENKKPKSDTVDIHKVIDDAMEKRDRSVTIFISKEATTVSVYPYPDEEPRWIPIISEGQTYPISYRCSSCGHEIIARTLPPYCDLCGEKLKQPE